tara:strand:+ start:1099 stop:1488 length:390 start_codon:yes stop_codon:yes gene_type:complete
MRFRLWSLLFVFVLAGCSGMATASRGGNTNVITGELIREGAGEGLNVYQVIERNRPQWFNAGRSAPTLGYAEGGRFARVVLNGALYGDLDDLRRINTVEVTRLEYMSARDATTRFGTGYAGGAILVSTR